MTATDILAPQKVEQTIFALIATYLSTGTQDIPGKFPTVPVSSIGLRTFQFENNTYNIMARAEGDILLYGVSIFFGTHVPDRRNVKPQIIHSSVIVHVVVPYGSQKMGGKKLAERIGSKLEQAFEGLGAHIPMFDCTVNPPVQNGRYVSWARQRRFDWREAGDPSRGVSTNRIGVRAFRYTK